MFALITFLIIVFGISISFEKHFSFYCAVQYNNLQSVKCEPQVVIVLFNFYIRGWWFSLILHFQSELTAGFWLFMWDRNFPWFLRSIEKSVTHIL